MFTNELTIIMSLAAFDSIVVTVVILILAFLITRKSVIEDNARQVAEVQCRADYYMRQQQKTVAEKENIIAMNKYASKLAQEMESKYTTEIERTIYINAYCKILEDCQTEKASAGKITSKWKTWFAGSGDKWNEGGK